MGVVFNLTLTYVLFHIVVLTFSIFLTKIYDKNTKLSLQYLTLVR